MALIPIESHPGVFKDTVTGYIVNIRDFIPWETSDKFEGQDYVFKPCHDPARIIIQGCRVSFAETPSRLALQQLAVLMVNGQVEAIATLERWCVDNVLKTGVRDKTFQMLGDMDVQLRIALSERPVEGCGLRVHLRGVKSCFSCYGERAR